MYPSTLASAAPCVARRPHRGARVLSLSLSLYLSLSLSLFLSLCKRWRVRLPLARGAVQDEAGAVVLAGVGRRVLATAAAAPGTPGELEWRRLLSEGL